MTNGRLSSRVNLRRLNFTVILLRTKVLHSSLRAIAHIQNVPVAIGVDRVLRRSVW
ncbi:hypothetical protein IQ268_26205 [Oculatella sp. LEGE 06141]|uniref:hypothetical protein n=1 Tax=Oculatella sp. LEGE 06141 TaxID=1828648 RepID=UPI00187EDDF0|nr:hypothetical protein [Oculatella sp. LEGE 06141]MBE9182063.1 hypothetical protein [Oculatella sp. LEGE 06141]